MKFSARNITIIAFSLATVGALVFVFQRIDWVLFNVKEGLADNWNDIFTKYIFIVVAIERAVSVWIGVKRNEQFKAWNRRVKRINELFIVSDALQVAAINQLSVPELTGLYKQEQRIVSKLPKNKLEDLPAPSSSGYKKDDLIGYLRNVRIVYDFRFNEYKQVTNDLSTKGVFLGGLFMAVVGLSFLNDIIQTQEEIKGLQLFVYRFADIVITGGLLGGGSTGLTKLFDALDDFFDRK